MVGVSLMISGSACGDKDIFPAVDKGEAGQAQAGFAGVAGFSAQDFTAGDGSAVQGLEHGADKGDAVRMDISRGGGIAACGEKLTEFFIAQGVCKKNGKILSSGVQPLFMQPGGIGKACIFHAKFFCLAVHQDCEGFLRAGYGVGKGQAAFCAGGKKYAVKQIPALYGLAGLEARYGGVSEI